VTDDLNRALGHMEEKHPGWKAEGLILVDVISDETGYVDGDGVWNLAESMVAAEIEQSMQWAQWLEEVRDCTCTGRALKIVFDEAERRGLIAKIPIPVPEGAPANVVRHMTVHSERRRGSPIVLYRRVA
jgi:hypothetical protein